MNHRTLALAILPPLLFLPLPSLAQEGTPDARSSLGLHAAYTLTPGEWSSSPIDKSVKLFAGGLSFEGDLEFRLGPRWTLAVAGAYATLAGSEWEKRAAEGGDRIEISGWMAHAALLLRPHVPLGARDMLRFEFGPAVLFSSGAETLDGVAYTYQQLPGFAVGGTVGAEYLHLFGGNFALSLRAGILFFPGAAESAYTSPGTILIVPVALGLRFLL